MVRQTEWGRRGRECVRLLGWHRVVFVCNQNQITLISSIFLNGCPSRVVENDDDDNNQPTLTCIDRWYSGGVVVAKGRQHDIQWERQQGRNRHSPEKEESDTEKEKHTDSRIISIAEYWIGEEGGAMTMQRWRMNERNACLSSIFLISFS